MKAILISGVAVSVLTESEIKRYGLNYDDFIMIGSQEKMYIKNLSRKEALIASGYDLDKVDFALPQDWINEKMLKAIKACFDDPEGVFKSDNWVWDYSNETVFGKPLYVGGWKRRILRGIIEKFVEE
jgi:hypothetical protein